MALHKPLTVLFDANPLATSGKSGVGYYTYGLIAALAATYPNDLRLIGQYFDFLGRKGKLDLPTAPNISYHATRIVPGKLIQGLRRFMGIDIPMELLTCHRGDVLFFPNFALRPSLFRKPRIATIHDLYFTERPDHINDNNLDFLQKFVPRAVKQATHIFAVSAFTKCEIERRYLTDSRHITVTPIPPQAMEKPSPTVEKELLNDMGITSSYLLFLGNLEPRKNLVSLIEAYKGLSSPLRRRYSLVLAGGRGWKDDSIQAAIAATRAEGLSIITPGYVSDAQKSALYRHAALFVLPSYYEGFGMQLLEAMSYSIPITASNIPAFYEVAGNAVQYFNPQNVPSITNALEGLLTDAQQRHILVEQGSRRLRKYNWSNVAQTVYKVLKEVAHD